MIIAIPLSRKKLEFAWTMYSFNQWTRARLTTRNKIDINGRDKRSSSNNSLLKKKFVETESELPTKSSKVGKKKTVKSKDKKLEAPTPKKDVAEFAKKSKKKSDKATKRRSIADLKVAKAIEQMSQHFGQIHIGNINELHIGSQLDSSLSFECSSSCSCSNETRSSSDNSYCNCWTCLMEPSSGSDETSISHGDLSTAIETSSGSGSSEDGEDDTFEKKQKAARRVYDLRNRSVRV